MIRGYVDPFNKIKVISSQLKAGNERLCALIMKPH